jgi:hypothetical protein
MAASGVPGSDQLTRKARGSRRLTTAMSDSDQAEDVVKAARGAAERALLLSTRQSNTRLAGKYLAINEQFDN